MDWPLATDSWTGHWRLIHRLRFPGVAWLGRQPCIVDVRSHGEVIKALECVAREPEQIVDRIVIETADAGAANTRRFGFEIQHLADDARFPEQMAVEGRATRVEAALEVGDHPEAETAVAGNCLIAADALRDGAAIAARQREERQRRVRRLPLERAPAGG